MVLPVLLVRKYFAGAVAIRSPCSKGVEQITQIPNRSERKPSSFGFILDHFFLLSELCRTESAAQSGQTVVVPQSDGCWPNIGPATVRSDGVPLAGTRHSPVRRWSPVGPAT